MQAKAAKSALFFHAKDDVPEVRHAVFKRLLKHDLHLSVAVKDKEQLGLAVLQRQVSDSSYRYNTNGHELYDWLIAGLFKHSDWMLGVAFKRFGKSGSSTVNQVILQSTCPSKSAGLQACDYLHWALQRFYERGEERYLHAMW